MWAGGAHYLASVLTGVVWRENLATEEEFCEDKVSRLGIPRNAARVYKNEGTELQVAGPDRKGACARLQMVNKVLICHEQIMEGIFFASARGNASTHLTHQKYSK